MKNRFVIPLLFLLLPAVKAGAQTGQPASASKTEVLAPGQSAVNTVSDSSAVSTESAKGQPLSVPQQSRVIISGNDSVQPADNRKPRR